jgi:hypothetical protein
LTTANKALHSGAVNRLSDIEEIAGWIFAESLRQLLEFYLALLSVARGERLEPNKRRY